MKVKVKKKGVTDAEIPLTNQVQGPYCRVQTKKTRIVRYLLYVWVQIVGKISLQQTFEFQGLYGEIQPSQVTNFSPKTYLMSFFYWGPSSHIFTNLFLYGFSMKTNNSSKFLARPNGLFFFENRNFQTMDKNNIASIWFCFAV